jgi:hypothetical protein
MLETQPLQLLAVGAEHIRLISGLLRHRAGRWLNPPAQSSGNSRLLSSSGSTS